MSLASLEREILKELREVTKNKKLTKNSIQEWSTTPVETEAGEKNIELQRLKIFVTYKE